MLPSRRNVPDEPPNYFDEISAAGSPEPVWPDAGAASFPIDIHVNGVRSIQIMPGELHNLADSGEAAITERGLPVFQRGRELVRPVQQDVPASKGRITVSAGMAKISHPGMRDLLSQAAHWTKWDPRKKKLVPVDPPKDVAEIILSRVGEWRVPVVAGVITTPTLRPDGTVLHQAGYDETTRLYQINDHTLKPAYIPPEPTELDAQRAVETLNSLLDEFPFVSDADRSVALSALITPVVRGAVSVAPLHAIKASTAGTGKSYLADLASAISTGRPCPVISVSADPKETESRLTGLLLAAFPLISLDNVNGELGGDLLCQAVERPTVRLRRLGGSDIFEVESRATFFATGNGLRVKGDMTRRTVLCNLDAGIERPETREFSHSPVDDVLADRGKYIAAALTIVRAYIVAGKPGCLRQLASFEEWSDLVRSALVWLKLPDPALTMEATREDDPELNALRDLITCWKAAIGTREVTVREAIEIGMRKQDTMLGDIGNFEYPEFRDALLTVAGQRGNLDATRLGRWLMGREGRIISGLRLRRGEIDGHSKVRKWKVE